MNSASSSSGKSTRSPQITPIGSSSSISADLVRIADELGFNHVAITPLSIRDRDQLAYKSWCDDGFAADMGYLTRDPEKRLSPQSTFPPATSVLTLAVSYYQGPFPEKPGPGFGRVARYAWGRDYHTVMQERLAQFLDRAASLLHGRDAILAVDTKPLLERSLAAQAGLGFVGKNTVLIVPASPRLKFHVGSWVFLAEILLADVGGLPPVALPAVPAIPAKGGCGSCTRCLDHCPTSAFESAYRLDARKCISYLTIENKGWIARALRSKMGDWIFGCDVCQEVCPYNARALDSKWPEFAPHEGAGAWVSLHDVLMSDDASFRARWGRTPLSRPKRRGLVRNACVVAGNSGDETLAEPLASLLLDVEPVVRGHALWALARLKTARMKSAAEKLLNDPDAQVRAEAQLCLEAAA
jgi:epoxyqueuosine reductase